MKKFIIIFIMCVCAFTVKAQNITDSATLRNYINTYIIPNSTRSITAGQMSTILNGILNTMNTRGGTTTSGGSDCDLVPLYLDTTDISEPDPGQITTQPSDYGTYVFVNGTWVSLAGGGGGGSAYFAGNGLLLSGTTFRVDTTLISTRAWRNKLADSLAALIAAGSGVISVAKGYGLKADGTITTTGTITVDTFVMATRVWRNKLGDSLSNVAAATYVPLTRNINSGNGLTGGGDLSADRTLKVDTTIISTRNWRDKLADSLAAIIATKQPQLSGTGFVKATGTTISYDNSTYTPTSRTLTAGVGLTGGGDLSANRTFNVDTGRTSIAIATGGALNKIADSIGAIISTGGIQNQYASQQTARAWIDSLKAVRIISNQYYVGSTRYAVIDPSVLFDSAASVKGLYMMGDNKQAGTYNRAAHFYWDASDTNLYHIDVSAITGATNSPKNIKISTGGTGSPGNLTIDAGTVTIGRSGGGQILLNNTLNVNSDATTQGNHYINGGGLNFSGTTRNILNGAATTTNPGVKFSIIGGDAGPTATNAVGGDIEIISGMGRGSGISNIKFKTSPGSVSSGVLNTATTKLTIDGSNVVINTALSISKPIITTGSTPSNSAGTGAGTSPTISITGNDVAGYVTVTTGTSPTAGGDIVTITFTSANTNTPKAILLSAGNDNAAIEIAKYYADISTMSTTSFVIKNTSSALTAATTYKIFYNVIQ